MAFTQADLDKQDAAIASPIEEEHFADRGIRRRTIDDLIKAREYAATQKADADAAAAGKIGRAHV